MMKDDLESKIDENNFAFSSDPWFSRQNWVTRVQVVKSSVYLARYAEEKNNIESNLDQRI